MSKANGKDVVTFCQEDHLKSTCEIIYERHRRKKLEQKYFSLIIFSISIILSIGTILCITFVNYDEAFAAKNQRTDYLESTHSSCEKISYGVIDLISTPVAIALVMFYVVLYKRRIFIRDKYKYKNIGLPMILTNWSKSTRFNSAMVYGLIALSIFEIILSTIGNSQADIDIKNTNDPSGLLKLLFRIAQVIFVGISRRFKLFKKYAVKIMKW